MSFLVKTIRFRVRTIVKALVVVAALLGFGALVFSQHPLWGRLPAGERLARLAQSPNYADGAFRNLVDTPMLTTEESRLSIMIGNTFGKAGNRRPQAEIPAIRTDLSALDPVEDLVIWLGHSSYFVQLAGRRILIDPVFSTNAAPIPGANVAFEGTSLYTADDMPEIDLLLITHDHYDHLDYRSIRDLLPRVRQVVAGLGIGAHFEAWGYAPEIVHEADWYETVRPVLELEIHVTPARHYSGRTFTRDKSLWAGFALTTAERRIFISGDSGYGEHFAEIGRRYGPFDWVTLDAGQYDPRWANVHMTPEEAAQAAEDLRASALTPGHAGRFSIAPHDWNDPFLRIVAASEERSYALWTPEIGRAFHLDGRSQVFSPWWENVR
ncbi:MBL fold metallo-hydrolase [Pleomorphomonas carboxyditropha]|uniref:MBL fold metallo-hydrolase n=1 Tax=Pleomorphomonas carboxyditropha TaxID=2023338 RepID=A0A2G9WXK8_9HYPH|nr:MBL fold metallo-hydrolase [Pleomorphomonas carboxyditropha]PIO99447.1 MBL fold metallo-hydrolase [Pleomorphomonas carboxyditropha]